MKTSQSLFSTAVKVTFVLFGVLPLIGLAAFGDLRSFSLAQSEISWLEIDLMLGAVFFVSYLLIGSVSKSKTRLPMKKIYA
ncbi:hypothetical protein [Nitrosomonas oligotropha]|uniref:Uncharacterized protein n=1 Tax=Nitrosomonas oligotropha TaxID=42354 RepID=A0A1H8PEL6_9PROT|nr:hypothetical protein [Nitrosomonas oligotropha]SDW77541.1 hypothetical protein SAMN05216300_11060 [Nitrosomonas oligotropha]SEO40197.1 hypothetical protein SAMN05216333_10960 [Nitrosomonas oligotropha]